MRSERRAPAGTERWPLAALWVIIAVTMAWWALALWPLPEEGVPWLIRAREICFGSTPDGLPGTGGWVLLIGEPLGMVGFLLLGWGASVREGLRKLWSGSWGRAFVTGTVVTLAVAASLAGARIAEARSMRFEVNTGGTPAGRLIELGEQAPELGLVDQNGQRVTLAGLGRRPVLVAFAFAHCTTACPLLIRRVLDVAAEPSAVPPAVVVVTLDPWRDTPARLPAIAEQWDLPEGTHLLSGAAEDVDRVLNRWKVPRVRNRATGDLIHPSVVYVLTSDGRIAYLTDGRPSLLREALARVTPTAS